MFQKIMQFVPLLCLTTLSAAILGQTVMSAKSCFQLVFSGPANRQVYDFANDHLVELDNSSSDDDDEFWDWETQLENIIQWLNEGALSSGCFTKSAYTQAQRQLEALRGLEDDKYCNETSIRVVRKNHQATNYITYQANLTPPVRPIDTIVHHYLSKHAEQCSIRHAEEFNKRMVGLEQEKLRIVQTIGSGFLNGRVQYLSGNSKEPKWTPTSLELLRTDLNQLEQFNLTRLISIDRKPSVKVIFDSLRYVARDDPNIGHLNRINSNPRSNNKERVQVVHELFSRYLLVPCKYHSGQFRPGLLQPAIYEIRMLDPSDKTRMLNSLDYYVALVATQICQYIRKQPFLYRLQLESLTLMSAGIIDE